MARSHCSEFWTIFEDLLVIAIYKVNQHQLTPGVIRSINLKLSVFLGRTERAITDRFQKIRSIRMEVIDLAM